MSLKPILTGEDVLNYIPQRPPFVMVDSIYEKGDAHVISGLTVTEDNIMSENDVLKDGGIIENIAQTAALYAGTKFKDAGLEVPVGYIAGIKHLKITKSPAVGDKIYTTTTLTNEMMNIQIVNGEVRNDKQEVIATCELRIFINQ